MPYKLNKKLIFKSAIKTNSIKTFKTKIFMVMFFLFLGITSIAQVPPPPNNGGQNDEVPISSFVAIGLIAGATYGIKKVK